MIESEKQTIMSFFDVQIIHEDKTFTTSIYHKPIVEFVHILTDFTIYL